ncbi:MAG: glycosyltransferase, partial [Candidatus Roizmanbacteria bacterium]
MKVSVIVTTKNEEKNIENCLHSVKKQSYPQDDIEIIVVDNNSSDKTKKLAKKYTKNVFNKGPERSAQRNFGVSKSKGDYILYLDADMILHASVIKSAAALCAKQPNLVGLYISEIVLGDSFFSKIRRFERSFYDATVIDCVRFVKRSIFKKVGGFDTKMSGPEDWDLDKKIRANGQTLLLKTPIYHN